MRTNEYPNNQQPIAQPVVGKWLDFVAKQPEGV